MVMDSMVSVLIKDSYQALSLRKKITLLSVEFYKKLNVIWYFRLVVYFNLRDIIDNILIFEGYFRYVHFIYLAHTTHTQSRYGYIYMRKRVLLYLLLGKALGLFFLYQTIDHVNWRIKIRDLNQSKTHDTPNIKNSKKKEYYITSFQIHNPNIHMIETWR